MIEFSGTLYILCPRQVSRSPHLSPSPVQPFQVDADPEGRDYRMSADGDTEAGGVIHLRSRCHRPAMGSVSGLQSDRTALPSGLPPEDGRNPPWDSPMTKESDVGTDSAGSAVHMDHTGRVGPLQVLRQRQPHLPLTRQPGEHEHLRPSGSAILGVPAAL